jgi:hypothetical protein
MSAGGGWEGRRWSQCRTRTGCDKDGDTDWKVGAAGRCILERHSHKLWRSSRRREEGRGGGAEESVSTPLGENIRFTEESPRRAERPFFPFPAAYGTRPLEASVVHQVATCKPRASINLPLGPNSSRPTKEPLDPIRLPRLFFSLASGTASLCIYNPRGSNSAILSSFPSFSHPLSLSLSLSLSPSLSLFLS